MEREAAYPAARIVSPKVHAYFTRQRAEIRVDGNGRLATLPDTATIQAIVDAAFWASLRREEGFIPKISLAFLAPEETGSTLLFERPLPLEPGILTKVAPAVERPGIHLGVSHGPEGLRVWGATRAIPSLCFVVEVAAPGLIVIKHHSSDTAGKFVNVAVLEGDQVKMVDERASAIPDCPALLSALLGSDSPAAWVHSVNVLVQLAVSMRQHGRGGSLLVVPAGDAWRESIVSPIPFAVWPPFAALADLARAVDDDPGALIRTVDAVAGLTAVDGAVVLTDQYEVLGFGAKIIRRKGRPLVEQVIVTEPIEGGVATLVSPDKLGGTRHLSAAQFVQDQHGDQQGDQQQGCAALVASQDGRFTVFEWSPCENMVYAHRIEALLL